MGHRVGVVNLCSRHVYACCKTVTVKLSISVYYAKNTEHQYVIFHCVVRDVTDNDKRMHMRRNVWMMYRLRTSSVSSKSCKWKAKRDSLSFEYSEGEQEWMTRQLATFVFTWQKACADLRMWFKNHVQHKNGILHVDVLYSWHKCCQM